MKARRTYVAGKTFHVDSFSGIRTLLALNASDGTTAHLDDLLGTSSLLHLRELLLDLGLLNLRLFNLGLRISNFRNNRFDLLNFRHDDDCGPSGRK